MKKFVIIALLIALPVTATWAITIDETSVENCARIENDLSRLICYDKLFLISENDEIVIDEEKLADVNEASIPLVTQPALAPPATPATPAITSASTANQMVNEEATTRSPVMSTEQIRQAEIDKFGAKNLKSDEDAEQLSRIDFVVESIKENARKIRTFTFTNGQVWRESENSRLRVKKGANIYIEKGAFSAYYLSTENSKLRVRVKRVK